MLGEIDARNLRGWIGGLRQAAHALENWGGETEDESMDTKFSAIRGAQNNVHVRGIEIVWSHGGMSTGRSRRGDSEIT